MLKKMLVCCASTRYVESGEANERRKKRRRGLDDEPDAADSDEDEGQPATDGAAGDDEAEADADLFGSAGLQSPSDSFATFQAGPDAVKLELLVRHFSDRGLSAHEPLEL